MHRRLIYPSAVLLLAFFTHYLAAQEARDLGVTHAECGFFGPRQRLWKTEFEFSRTAVEVASRLPTLPVKEQGERAAADTSTNIVDRYLSQAWKEAGVTPASRTNDFEFIRRATLDLTGRIPTAVEVQRFVADTDPERRTKLVNGLLNSPAWVDKWTMYFGDLYKNTVRTTQVVRYNEGRNAFYAWINKSLADNKPYNQIASELITASGANSYEQGELNWVVGGFVTGGPQQDIWDQQAMNVAQTFLGIGHMNCVMCHDGRRHLDTLSLWGKTATRYQAYQLSAFFSRTGMNRVRTGADVAPYYWNVEDNVRFRTDYTLNTSSGNRPPRTAVGTVRVVAPEYPFSGGKPEPGERYREALAREVTNDIQFSRATVNYLWKEFMTKAFVEPVNQFDPARLDPDNPPPEPWTLQPNQPRLLNALAAGFAANNYDLKALMRTIVMSEVYQLSSRYEGTWAPAYENLYARHLPRRLWAEEVHDAIVQSSGVPQNYAVPGLGTVAGAMKLPDVVNLPAEPMRSWLDSFMRGNRDNEARRSEGSTLQVLNLMNDSFVLSRTRASGSGDGASLLRKSLTGTDEQLVSALFLNVLSRYPTAEEKDVSYKALKAGNRQQKAEDLLWSLYNKVDFFFNY